MTTSKKVIWLVLAIAISILIFLGIGSTRSALVSASSPIPRSNDKSNFIQDVLYNYLPFLIKGQVVQIPTDTPTPTISPILTATPTPTITPIPPTGSPSSAIIINHNNRNITLIPPEWIQAAKDNVIWSYGSTSHGSQLYHGAEYLSTYVNPPTYNYFRAWFIPPDQGDPKFLRMGYNNGFSWDAGTFLDLVRDMLNQAPQANAFMWMWCQEMSYLSPEEVQQYLDKMTQLEGEYPGVRFVYATGVTDDTADQDALTRNYNIVRDYVLANDKILYDFADIESWLPDGTHYPGIPDDSCPWCQAWCDSHPGYCPVPEFYCDHSHDLNCYLKGQAFWWLSARLAGWDGTVH